MEPAPAFQRSARLRFWLFAGIVAIGLTLLTLMSGVAGWSDLNSVHHDLDITTGRVRQTRYVFYCKISERVGDTVVTKWLPPETVAVAQPDWRRVNTFCGWSRVSPHYTFHGATADIRQLEVTESLLPFSDEAKRMVSERIVGLWQTTNGDGAAGEYVRRIRVRVSELQLVGGKVLTAKDLPE